MGKCGCCWSLNVLTDKCTKCLKEWCAECLEEMNANDKGECCNCWSEKEE